MNLESFDPSVLAAFGVPLLALVFGLVEFFKSLFNMEGKKVTLLSAFMAILVFVPYQLIGFLPEVYAQALEVIYLTVAFGLAASGYYKFINKRTTKVEG